MATTSFGKQFYVSETKAEEFWKEMNKEVKDYDIERLQQHDTGRASGVPQEERTIPKDGT